MAGVRRSGGGALSNVTISDVASGARVSPATVSRVLNGGYPVAPGTRQQVEKVIRELGYVRNAHARALRTASSGVVGVIIHDVADPYFSEIVAGIQEVAAASHRLVLLCNSLRDAQSELDYIQMLRGQRVGALILAGGAIEDADYLRALRREAAGLKQQGARIVMCGRYSSVVTDVVMPDNRRGAELLTRFLIDRGHREIAEITGPANFSTTDDRSAGHRHALAESGVDRDDALVRAGDFSRDGGYEAMLQLIASGAYFTAVYAANDQTAVGALAALREAGLRVPDDVSLAGFDDIPTVRDVVPGLTTVRVPMREMGRRSVHLALSAPGRRPRKELLPVELVVRDSVAAPRRRVRRLA